MAMIPLPLPDAEELRAAFEYDPDTGVLRWRIKRGSVKPGTVTGKASPDGYCRLKFNDQTYTAHRVMWKIMTGRDPEKEIDHINGNPSDNRWANLREASHTENMSNCADYKKASGLPRGVAKNTTNRGFSAQIQASKRLIYLGTFPTPQEAHAAYRGAAKILHGKFSGLARGA